MAARDKTVYTCRECGGSSPKWLGKCPDCGQWDSLEEHRTAGSGAEKDAQRGVAQSVSSATISAPQAMPLSQVSTELSPASGPRLSTGIQELDRVLGGASENDSDKKKNSVGYQGFVPGSAVLIGGDPGVGKSTLMLQAADRLARNQRRVLYVSSEESAHQLRMRAQRLGAGSSDTDELFVLADTDRKSTRLNSSHSSVSRMPSSA